MRLTKIKHIKMNKREYYTKVTGKFNLQKTSVA